MMVRGVVPVFVGTHCLCGCCRFALAALGWHANANSEAGSVCGCVGWLSCWVFFRVI